MQRSTAASQSLQRPLIAGLVLTAVLALLTACGSNSSDKLFEDYLERLGRTLSVAPSEPQFISPPRPPRPGQMRLDIPPASLGALDFLAIGDCALQVTVGKRNSSLGKMARASQRLLLELEFLRLAPACSEALRAEGRTGLADDLDSAWSQKRAQLPALIFNATLGGEEFRSLWQASRSAGTYPATGSDRAITALGAINQQITRWFEGDFRADNRSFELWLGDIAGGPAGSLLRSLSRQNDWLRSANAVVEQRMARGPLCGPNLRHTSADILPNVIERYFVDGIQTRAALLERQRFELVPRITAIEQQLEEVLPEDYRTWQTARDTLLLAASGAPKQHVMNLVAIQEPCG